MCIELSEYFSTLHIVVVAAAVAAAAAVVAAVIDFVHSFPMIYVVSLSLAVINNVVLLFHLLQSISEFLKISHSSVFLAHAKSSSFLFPLTTQEFWCEVGYDGQVRWTERKQEYWQ